MANPKSKPIDTESIAELRARLAAAEAAEAEVAALIESARVACLKEQYTLFNEAFESAQSNLEAFEAGLSVADRALLGIKVQADRSPKGATLTTLRAHVASLAPGSRFTTAHLLEAVVPDASAATVRSALGQLGIEPIGKGKGAHYVIANQESTDGSTSESTEPTA